MWKLEHVSARGVCSFLNLEYTLQQGVTTLIFGKNADNENQQSNGSGKSTLIEAIVIGITGAPLRKVRTEEIINDAAEECSVHLRFANTATHEEFIIDRYIFRKGASNVRCSLYRAEVQEKVLQPSIDAYNKFILDKLGITRDELFSSFILSRHRYCDFLSSSDREKKEIINRFSNGVLVDQAIEKLQQDIEPQHASLKDVELEFAGLEGRIEMLSEQIHQEEESKQEKQRTVQEKIDAMRAAIAQKRNTVRVCDQAVAELKEKATRIESIDKEVQALEETESTHEQCIEHISFSLQLIISGKLTDWSEIIETKKREIDHAKEELDKWNILMGRASQKIVAAEKEHHNLREEFRAFGAEYDQQREELSEQVDSLGSRLSKAKTAVCELKKQRLSVNGAIEFLGAKLAGTIECPSCGHMFLVSDKKFDVKDARRELDEKCKSLETLHEVLAEREQEVENVEMMQAGIQCESRVLDSRKVEWEERLAKAERAVQSAQYEMEGYKFNMTKIQELVAAREREIVRLREDIFEDAYAHIDAAARSNERAIAEMLEQRAASVSCIETLQATIEELKNTSGEELLESLKKSLRSYRAQSSVILARKTELEKHLAALMQQEQVFAQFKSYLANSKIDALSMMMNRILEDLGSDLRVSLSGYTTLKTGTVREKISVSIIRDGVDAGSFGKFSEGEKARVNLASIVAMQRLVNGNCEFGKGLDLILIDEVIDSMDADGLASVFSALNKQNITALVVSHGAVAEGYKHRLLITKRNGESSIDV